MRLASVWWTQSRFRWRFKMHCHRLHWKVSHFPHRQQDSKTCHVYYRASFAALTMAQRVHLLVGMGTRFLRTGSDWSRICHFNVENMHLRRLKHVWGLGWLNCMGFQTWGKEHYTRWCSDPGVSASVTITAFVEKQLHNRRAPRYQEQNHTSAKAFRERIPHYGKSEVLKQMLPQGL